MNEISLNRVKYLLSMQTSGGRKGILKWIISSILILGTAASIVWFEPWNYKIIYYITYPYFPYLLFAFFSKDKSQAANYLLLPASTKEKLIAHLILAVGAPTIMLALLIPAIILFQSLSNLYAGQSALSYMPVLGILTVNNFIAGLFLQSLYGFAALSFKKWAFLGGLILSCLFMSCIEGLKSWFNLTTAEMCAFNGILFCLTVFVWIANHYKLKKIEI